MQSAEEVYAEMSDKMLHSEALTAWSAPHVHPLLHTILTRFGSLINAAEAADAPPTDPTAPPPWATAIQQSLDRIERTTQMTDKNLDNIARDWPTLRDAITQRLTDLTTQVATLTSELASTPADDPRAEEIDGEINTLLGQIKGTVTSAPAPTSTSASTPAAAAAQASTGGTPAPAPSVSGGTGGAVSG